MDGFHLKKGEEKMFNKRLLKTFKAEMKNVYGLVLIQWLVLICHILLTFLHSYVLSCLYLKQSFSLVFYLLSVICLFALKCFLQTTQNKQALSLSEMIKTKLRKSVFDKIYHQKQTTVFKESTLTQLTSEGIDQLEIYFSKYIPQFFYAMLAPLTLFIVVGFMSLKVALILLLCVPLIPVSIVIVQKIAKRLLAKYWNSYTGLADSFLENLQGLTTLKYYQTDLYYQDKMDREAEDFRKKTMRVLIMQLNSISVMDLVAYGGFGLGVVLGLQEYLNQHITFMMFVFIVMISIEFFLPLRMLGSYFHIGQNGNAAADKIFKLLDSLDDIQESYQESISTLFFEHVTFGYDEKIILKDVSFSLSKGIFLTIVGESGSGKSTIASLLMNLYPIQKGKILYNQETIPETMTLYQKITLIKDETYILKGTVFDHLAMSGCIDEEKMMAVLKEVKLFEVFENQGGLKFQLNEGAKNISGGQRQRLALARALLRESDVYIFDEATNNVDRESEEIILKIMKRLAKDKIVIFITHRMAHCKESQLTFVMKEGRLIQQGSYDELFNQANLFRELVENQKNLERIIENER